MPRNKTYTQCELRQGATFRMSWIPSGIAKKGQHVILRNSGAEEWSDPWLVLHTYATKPGEQVEDKSIDFAHQRSASDV